MSDKCILFSDFHIHNHGSDWRRVDDGLEVLDWIYNVAIERDIKTVRFAGDFFHVRGYMYPSIVSKVYKELQKFKDAGIDLHLLIGNHDMPYRHSTKHNCLTAFDALYPVVEQPMVDEGENWDFYYLPYVEEQDRLEWAINNIHEIAQKSSKKSALIAHLDIHNAVIHGNGTRSTHGISAKQLSKKFDMVFSGHYHTRQTLHDNVFFIGSPYQQNFSEAKQAKGITIFDNGELEFVENTFSPKYVYVNSKRIDDRIANNYVKIFAEGSDNIAAIHEEAMKFNPRNVTITIDNKNMQQEEKLVDIKSSAKDVKNLLKEWVEKNANEDLYDLNLLLKHGYDIVEGVSSDLH
jgi:DNA repair exonuclease SbcCD nuclease subunit